MAKPFIGYAIIGGYNPRSSMGFTILGVTSERAGQVYGRSLPGEYATHLNQRDVLYRFPKGTQEAFALAAATRAHAEFARHFDAIAQARVALQKLERDQRHLTLQAAKGLDADGK